MDDGHPMLKRTALALALVACTHAAPAPPASSARGWIERSNQNAQLLLQVLVLRDVAGGREYALQDPSRVPEYRRVIGDHRGAAVLRERGQFVVGDAPLAEH